MHKLKNILKLDLTFKIGSKNDTASIEIDKVAYFPSVKLTREFKSEIHFCDSLIRMIDICLFK